MKVTIFYNFIKDIVACRLKAYYMSQSGRLFLSNVYNQNAYFSGKGGVIS
jgi:hypothetical protein